MPSPRTPLLSTVDHRALDAYFSALLDAVRDGVLTPDVVREEVVQAIAAVDKGSVEDSLNRAANPAERIQDLAGQRS